MRGRAKFALGNFFKCCNGDQLDALDTGIGSHGRESNQATTRIPFNAKLSDVSNACSFRPKETRLGLFFCFAQVLLFLRPAPHKLQPAPHQAERATTDPITTKTTHKYSRSRINSSSHSAETPLFKLAKSVVFFFVVLSPLPIQNISPNNTPTTKSTSAIPTTTIS